MEGMITIVIPNTIAAPPRAKGNCDEINSGILSTSQCEIIGKILIVSECFPDNY